jgi:preprotein translocase subunit Sss1
MTSIFILKHSIPVDYMSVWIEAVVVALATGIVGFIIATMLMFTDKDFSLQKYSFWPQVLFSYALTGFVIHLLAEWSGVNAWYCRNGFACLRK